jgi:hypothetical protein
VLFRSIRYKNQFSPDFKGIKTKEKSRNDKGQQMRMTPKAFDALATLLRLRVGSARYEAARLIFVEGASTKKAMAATGVPSSGASFVRTTCKKGIALVKIIYEETLGVEEEC